MQLQEGTIPVTKAEEKKLEDLVVLALTRRDPGEQGPLIVTTPDGEVEV